MQSRQQTFNLSRRNLTIISVIVIVILSTIIVIPLLLPSGEDLTIEDVEENVDTYTKVSLFPSTYTSGTFIHNIDGWSIFPNHPYDNDVFKIRYDDNINESVIYGNCDLNKYVKVNYVLPETNRLYLSYTLDISITELVETSRLAMFLVGSSPVRIDLGDLTSLLYVGIIGDDFGYWGRAESPDIQIPSYIGISGFPRTTTINVTLLVDNVDYTVKVDIGDFGFSIVSKSKFEVKPNYINRLTVAAKYFTGSFSFTNIRAYIIE
jgi:hypothetical protein